MFNFLNFKLSPKVFCDSQATEHYEVENLISSQAENRSRGFITYPSTKPPVEIEFEFICPVNIHYIVLNTTVGSQKCSGIEIFTKTSFQSYTSLCRTLYDTPKICFCNGKKYSRRKPPPGIDFTNYELSFFKSSAYKLYLNGSAIKILIFRTNKSLPCLASVEVWGTPSKSCSLTTIQTINYLMQESPNASCTNTPSTSDKTVDNASINKASDNKFEIPEDFKDALTCEIMTIPMTLPCGKNIDQATLEKHVQSEKSFSRKPCDPFTGVKFTESIKPILNVALKSRIDMFILQNAHRPETYNLKRTLGGTSSQINCRVSDSTESSSASTNKKFKSDQNEDLSPGPSSSYISNKATEKAAINGCSRCKRNDLNFLYFLPCKHRFCRNCLLALCENKAVLCPLCIEHFPKYCVEKINV